MDDKLGYTLIGTTTLITTCGWATVATIAAVGLTAYVIYEKAIKQN